MYMKDDNGMPRVVAAITVDACLLGGMSSTVEVKTLKGMTVK